MTRKAFIKVLKEKGYSYEIEGDKVVVTRNVIFVSLGLLQTIPPGVEFRNRSNVFLSSLETLPSDVVFNNGDDVFLDSLQKLHPGVEFKNGGVVNLESLKTLPPGVEFNNRGDIKLDSLVGGWFSGWSGNIKGIDSKRLLNLMIKQGVFI